MRKAKQYLKEELEIDVPNSGTIPGSWFAENHLPMVVSCKCCETTMSLFSANIDDDGDIYCDDCSN